MTILLARGRRPVIAVLALVACVAAVITPGDQPAAAGCGGVHTSGRWQTIDLPASASRQPTPLSGPANYPVFAAARTTPDLVVTDAERRTVFHSANGGCTWRQALSLSGQPGVAGAMMERLGYTVMSIAFGQPAGRKSPSVYALIVDEAESSRIQAADDLPVFLARSANGGRSWTIAGLDDTGDLDDTTRHPRCTTALLVVDAIRTGTVSVDCTVRSTGGGEAVFVSRDAGEHWTRSRGDGMPQSPYMPNAAFSADPMRAGTLWSVGSRLEGEATGSLTARVGEYVSRDLGEHWALSPLASTQLVGADLATWVSQTATSDRGHGTIVFAAPKGAQLSRDAGRHWRLTGPIGPDSTAVDLVGVAAFGDAAVYGIRATPHRSWDGGSTARHYYCQLLRTKVEILKLDRQRRWHNLGAGPVPRGTAILSVQPGRASQGSIVYGLLITVPDPQECSGYTARLVGVRVS